MAKRQSVLRARQRAVADDKAARADPATARTWDSFQNFMFNMGVGTDNPTSASTYGFNPITRVQVLLEWIHRGSWLGGIAVDLVADDMTKGGIELLSTMPPDDSERIQNSFIQLGLWESVNDLVKWSRLYGGAIMVALIDGQDTSTPLRPRTIGPGQLKGFLVLDRWMVSPSLENLVTDLGPYLGQPKFYRIEEGAPALSGSIVHYSRCIRMDGLRLPYRQRLQENLWGLSVLERLYDRMIAFDSATSGAAQLVYKSYLRTVKIKDFREAVSAGNDATNGVIKYLEMMRRFQGIEGLTILDAEDDFQTQQTSAFGGLSEALQQFGQQLSGALQIPLVRLFGQSPGGLNSSGDSDLRTYYDGINQQQERTLRLPFGWLLPAIARSERIELPANFNYKFKSLWQMTPEQNANIASTRTSAVLQASQDGVISQAVALKELRQVGRDTGTFTNISDADIEQAEMQPMPDPGNELGVDPNDLVGYDPTQMQEPEERV